MSTTTTSQTPENEGPPEGPTRPARLIQNEATTEIPVHLLFRDDPDPVSVPLKPAVVARRQGTGEQPRFRRPVPAKPRPAPEVDPDLAERPARVLPGTAGVLAGSCGLAGCLATSWWAGVLPPLATQALRLPFYAGAGLGPAQWAAYAGAGALGLFGFGGLARGRTGRAWVLGLFGRYRGPSGAPASCGSTPCCCAAGSTCGCGTGAVSRCRRPTRTGSRCGW